MAGMNDGKKLVAAAAAKHALEPEALLDFKIYADKVAIILPTGQKFVYHYADLVGFFTGAAEPEAEAEAPPVTMRKGRR